MEYLKQFKKLKETEFKRWLYPGGEVGVRLTAPMPENLLWRIQNSNDLMALIMASCTGNGVPKNLLIPYIPYARQDRKAVEGDPNAIWVFARQLILALSDVRCVYCLDAHSGETRKAFGAMGVDFKDIDPVPYIAQFMQGQVGRKRDFIFVSPDAGALEKTRRYATYLGVNGIIQCAKGRDPATGALKHFYVESVNDAAKASYEEDSDCEFMIVDDICDGGRSFLGVKSAVRELYPDAEFSLWTSHGIYSQGLDVLAKEFKRIGSTDSFLHGLTHPALTTIPLIPKDEVPNGSR